MTTRINEGRIMEVLMNFEWESRNDTLMGFMEKNTVEEREAHMSKIRKDTMDKIIAIMEG